MKVITLSAALLAATAFTAPAFANDTMAELKAGGLYYINSENVQMAQEDLYLSMKEVRVDYVFHNSGDTDETSVIAFPMPDVEGSGDFMVTIPNENSDNFMDFSVSVEGKEVKTKLDQHAFAAEVDVTALLRKYNVPLQPYGQATSQALNGLSEDVLKDMMSRGMVVNIPYSDTADGPMKDDYVPMWKLKTTYWWTNTFPAGSDVHVSHRYKPSVGGTTGLRFLNYGDGERFSGETFDQEKIQYCMDDGFLKSVGKRLDAAGPDETPLVENWMSYVLTTGQNWGGTIGKFHLTVDKGDPNNLISFCGNGIKKTGPTTFEMSADDFYPEKDIDLMILVKPDWNQPQ
ncbi:DUF4424 domain-containing protein [Oryzibacter oryziterrae]|uniref:DUF4424 domain-containing protein n=1 Tax=Oryzibacter oryziterrae TaxID=2766474 RepID=UPI001F3A5CDF|nr:DUF4424 domain-containing protein [Oryzibacter oryziterrae]